MTRLSTSCESHSPSPSPVSPVHLHHQATARPHRCLQPQIQTAKWHWFFTPLRNSSLSFLSTHQQHGDLGQLSRIGSQDSLKRQDPRRVSRCSSGTCKQFDTHYVQVESDGTFQIILHATDAYRSRHGIHVEIRLDGHKVDGSLIRLKNLHKTGGHVFYGAQSKMNGKWFISDFKFSQFVLGK